MAEYFIYALCGLAVAFAAGVACLYFYRRGVRDGMRVAEGREPEPVKRPAILQTKEEKTLLYEEKKAKETERDFERQVNELLNFQPGYKG